MCRIRWVAFSTAAVAMFTGCASSTTVPTMPAIEGPSRTFRFSSQDEGKLPAEWIAERTGRGEGSLWRVVADSSAPSGSGFVLAQQAAGPRSMFNLCVLREGHYKDVMLEVSLKAIKGDIDQGGGLVWRYIDANNYYLCRYNPLEGNFRIYKVIAGKRKQLAGTEVPAERGDWHRLAVSMQADLIVCTLDRIRLAVRDDTLTDAGRIGLWTKADAQTSFDSLRVTGYDRDEARRN